MNQPDELAQRRIRRTIERELAVVATACDGYVVLEDDGDWVVVRCWDNSGGHRASATHRASPPAPKTLG